MIYNHPFSNGLQAPTLVLQDSIIGTSPDFSDTLHTMFIQGANSVYMDEVTFAQLDISLDVNTTLLLRMQSILGVKESI